MGGEEFLHVLDLPLQIVFLPDGRDPAVAEFLLCGAWRGSFLSFVVFLFGQEFADVVQSFTTRCSDCLDDSRITPLSE